MVRGFETGSDNEKIDELQKQLDDVLDSQISSVGGNEDISIDSSRGGRNAASGDAGGVRSNEPIIHNITDVDEGGTPTGVFDKINIISSMAIIDHTSTPITLRFIQGTAKDGARIKITPKIGKEINIESGGNILTSSTITITDGDFYELVKYSEAETGVTGGAYKIFLSATGGIGEPIILGVNELTPQTLPTTTEISWDTNNPQHILLDRAVEFNFTNLPANGSYEGVLVIIDIDGVGGFASPIWPGSVVNSPIIPTTADQRFSVMLYTINGGLAVTHATSVGSSTSVEFFGPWTANHDAGVNSLVNAAAVAYVDTLGFPRGTIAGDNGATALRLSLDTGGKFLISDVLTDILEIDDTTGLTMLGSHVINMGNNIINSISELQFSNANAHTPSNELSIAFDTNDDALKYSVALTTDVHMFFADTDLLATFSRVGSNEGLLSIQAVTAVFLQATENLFLSTFNNTVLSDGEIWRDSGDGKFKFRENGTTQELGGDSDIISAGDSFIQIIDAATGFASFVFDGVTVATMQNNRMDFQETDLFGIEQINMNDSGANLISSLTASASGLLLNILSTSNFYDIKFNSADAFHVDDIRTRILSTAFNISPAVLSLFRDDASPTIADELGLIKFDGRNSAAEFITYAEISTTIESITDGSESANLFVNIKQNGFDVDMLRLVNGSMILRTFTSVGGDGANYTLLKEDDTPLPGELIGNVNWNVLDGATETTYSRIQTFIVDATDAALWKVQLRSDNILQDALIIEGNDNSTQFQFLTSSNGNTRMQPLSSAVNGYFVTSQVTDFTLSLGTSGSLEIPQINDGSPSLNDLNQAGGAFDGAIVHDINDGTLYIRNNSGQWDFYNRSGTVV